jgi:acyl transferase domain-containing protein
MFSGQGSQYYQMGRALFEGQRTFRKWLVELDEIARHLTGRSIIKALYFEGHKVTDPFDCVALTHPAIFMIEVALAQSLIETGTIPDYVLGVSLGSFAASVIAGCIECEDALSAVVRQAAAIEKHCEPGGMIAIVSPLSLYSSHDVLQQNCEIAAVNFPSHFVVSARREPMITIESFLRRKGILFQRLQVGYAFHSRWIDAASTSFCSYLTKLTYRPAQIPIVCCVSEHVLTQLPEQYLWTVARRPVRFDRTIERLETQSSYRYIDTGPSGTLATLLKYSLSSASKSQVRATLCPFAGDMSRFTSTFTDS